ncbi:MAG: type III-B CRISPR-associated protein Cas10/Cmr2, partial [Planctomycetota bacterium]
PPEGCGEPPTYYAVVTMDGDRMGEKLRVANEDEQRQISRWLSTFATKKVTRIVKDHWGELIYSGGDDVLAMLPVSTAIAAAGELAKTFRSGWPIKKQSATVSAGIAVVHYKEDLRFALDAARRAEVHAKESGRDALTLAICRRSGEHTSVLVPWSSVAEKSVTEKVDELVKHFIGGLSDRWTYALRTEVGSLPNYDAFEAELRRLLRRTEVILSGDKTDEDQEKAKERKEKAITDCCELLSLYRDAMKARTPNAEDRDRHICQWFTVLCQSASFLARGRDR